MSIKSVQHNLWLLLDKNKHLKDLPKECKHLISSNVAKSCRQYKNILRNRLLKSIKENLGIDHARP